MDSLFTKINVKKSENTMCKKMQISKIVYSKNRLILGQNSFISLLMVTNEKMGVKKFFYLVSCWIFCIQKLFHPFFVQLWSKMNRLAFFQFMFGIREIIFGDFMSQLVME